MAITDRRHHPPPVHCTSQIHELKTSSALHALRAYVFIKVNDCANVIVNGASPGVCQTFELFCGISSLRAGSLFGGAT